MLRWKKKPIQTHYWPTMYPLLAHRDEVKEQVWGISMGYTNIKRGRSESKNVIKYLVLIFN